MNRRVTDLFFDSAVAKQGRNFKTAGDMRTLLPKAKSIIDFLEVRTLIMLHSVFVVLTRFCMAAT